MEEARREAQDLCVRRTNTGSIRQRRAIATGDALAAELGAAAYVQADLMEDSQRKMLVRSAVAAWGRLDVLIDNAGISRVIPHRDLAPAIPEVWRELYEVNVVAPFRLVITSRS